MIQDEKALYGLVDQLSHEPRMALDTESNSLHTYRERVCLIQISTPAADYIVDPLSVPDVDPLGPLLSSSGMECVFHAAEYDLMSLKRDFGFEIGRLFDTQTACRMLGRKKTGLASVLNEEFGVRQNKRYQRANWGKRPLSPEMLHYARLDTHYLLPLRDRLSDALDAAGVMEAAQETFVWQTTVAPADLRFDPHGFWRIAHSGRLSGRKVAVLRELYLFREEQARRLDRPPFKVFTDKTLRAIAQDQPATADELGQLEGMTKGQIRRYGKAVLEAVRRGLKAPRPARPRNQRTDDAIVDRFELLRQWRQKRAREQQVESDIILPREILWKIAREAPSNPRSLRRLMEPLEWRFRTYGDEILRIIEP